MSPAFPNEGQSLADTGIPQDWLPLAKQRWLTFLESRDPGWLAAPKGFLGVPWANPARHHAAWLAWLAYKIDGLFAMSAPSSRGRLNEKIQELVRAPDEAVFTERWTELELGHFLGERFGSVICEPLAGDDSAAQAPSPDWSFWCGDEVSYCEVTVARVQALEDWQRLTETVTQTLPNLLVRAGAFVDVLVRLPFVTSSPDRQGS